MQIKNTISPSCSPFSLSTCSFSTTIERTSFRDTISILSQITPPLGHKYPWCPPRVRLPSPSFLSHRVFPFLCAGPQKCVMHASPLWCEPPCTTYSSDAWWIGDFFASLCPTLSLLDTCVEGGGKKGPPGQVRFLSPQHVPLLRGEGEPKLPFYFLSSNSSQVHHSRESAST